VENDVEWVIPHKKNVQNHSSSLNKEEGRINI